MYDFIFIPNIMVELSHLTNAEINFHPEKSSLRSYNNLYSGTSLVEYRLVEYPVEQLKLARNMLDLIGRVGKKAAPSY